MAKKRMEESPPAESVDLVDFRDVVKAVEIESVYLLESFIRRGDADPASHAEVDWNFQFGARLANVRDKHFAVDAILKATMVGPGSAGELVNLRATIRLEYTLTENQDPEKLRSFATVNGPFNAWPYWREYLQSSLARMSMPPLVLPAYKYSGGVLRSAAVKVQKVNSVSADQP